MAEFFLGLLSGIILMLLPWCLRWLREPVYIAKDEKDWSDATRAMLTEAGWTKVEPPTMGWILEGMVPMYLDKGRKPVKTGFFGLREVRAKTRDNTDMVLMTVEPGK